MHQLDFHNILFPKPHTDLDLIQRVTDIYDQAFVADYLNKIPNNKWTRETINRWLKGKASPKLSKKEYGHLAELLPKVKVMLENNEINFIELIYGIRGYRLCFVVQCVFR